MEKQQINGHPFISYNKIIFPENEMILRSERFFQDMDERRTVREFLNKPIPRKTIENIIKTAGTAPSGAHKQPWVFCVVSDPVIKKKIREEAEKEERESYEGRMNEEWIKDLEPLGTDWNKPFLETAPYLIVVFKKSFDLNDGKRRQNYYVSESVGIACGFLLAAIHNAGLASLTHTPSPMNFLTRILGRPENEKPYLLVPVGYPKPDTLVPDIKRKSLAEITEWYD